MQGGTRRGMWTAARILVAMRSWSASYGHPPTYEEWRASGSWWPCTSTVMRYFPTWSAAIEAAGLEPLGQGRRRAA